MTRTLQEYKNQLLKQRELVLLITCDLIVSVSWILQRKTTLAIPNYDAASQLFITQSFTPPMAIYGAILLAVNLLLIRAIVRHNERATALILAGLVSFWFGIALSAAIAVFEHKRITFSSFALSVAFGFWHYFASTRNEL